MRSEARRIQIVAADVEGRAASRQDAARGPVDLVLVLEARRGEIARRNGRPWRFGEGFGRRVRIGQCRQGERAWHVGRPGIANAGACGLLGVLPRRTVVRIFLVALLP